MKKNLILGLILTLVVTISACGGSTASNAGDLAPDFTLQDINGKSVTLSALLKEKPVILDFWASWCPPCRKEAPKLQEFYDKYKDKINVLGVNVNESQRTVISFMERMDLNYPMVLDKGEVSQAYGVTGIPSIVLIDQDSKILYFGHSVHGAESKMKEAGL